MSEKFDNSKLSIFENGEISKLINIAKDDYYHEYSKCQEPPSEEEFVLVVDRMLETEENSVMEDVEKEEQENSMTHTEKAIYGRVRGRLESIIGDPEKFGDAFEFERTKLENEKLEEVSNEIIEDANPKDIKSSCEDIEPKMEYEGGTLSLKSR